jgi:hypothetical protein
VIKPAIHCTAAELFARADLPGLIILRPNLLNPLWFGTPPLNVVRPTILPVTHTIKEVNA